MSTVEHALTWSGRGADVSVFLASPLGSAARLELAVGDDRPTSSSVLVLQQDSPPAWPGPDLVEVDAHFDALPADLAGYVGTLLRRALDLGAVVAWCAFEGSFHYDHLLTDDVADQVYGLASAGAGVQLALDDATLTGAAWAGTVRAGRAHLLSGS